MIPNETKNNNQSLLITGDYDPNGIISVSYSCFRQIQRRSTSMTSAGTDNSTTNDYDDTIIRTKKKKKKNDKVESNSRSSRIRGRNHQTSTRKTSQEIQRKTKKATKVSSNDDDCKNTKIANISHLQTYDGKHKRKILIKMISLTLKCRHELNKQPSLMTMMKSNKPDETNIHYLEQMAEAFSISSSRCCDNDAKMILSKCAFCCLAYILLSTQKEQQQKSDLNSSSPTRINAMDRVIHIYGNYIIEYIKHSSHDDDEENLVQTQQQSTSHSISSLVILSLQVLLHIPLMTSTKKNKERKQEAHHQVLLVLQADKNDSFSFRLFLSSLTELFRNLLQKQQHSVLQNDTTGMKSKIYHDIVKLLHQFCLEKDILAILYKSITKKKPKDIIKKSKKQQQKIAIQDIIKRHTQTSSSDLQIISLMISLMKNNNTILPDDNEKSSTASSSSSRLPHSDYYANIISTYKVSQIILHLIQWELDLYCQKKKGDEVKAKEESTILRKGRASDDGSSSYHFCPIIHYTIYHCDMIPFALNTIQRLSHRPHNANLLEYEVDDGVKEHIEELDGSCHSIQWSFQYLIQVARYLTRLPSHPPKEEINNITMKQQKENKKLSRSSSFSSSYKENNGNEKNSIQNNARNRQTRRRTSIIENSRDKKEPRTAIRKKETNTRTNSTANIEWTLSSLFQYMANTNSSCSSDVYGGKVSDSDMHHHSYQSSHLETSLWLLSHSNPNIRQYCTKFLHSIFCPSLDTSIDNNHLKEEQTTVIDIYGKKNQSSFLMEKCRWELFFIQNDGFIPILYGIENNNDITLKERYKLQPQIMRNYAKNMIDSDDCEHSASLFAQKILNHIFNKYYHDYSFPLETEKKLLSSSSTESNDSGVQSKIHMFVTLLLFQNDHGRRRNSLHTYDDMNDIEKRNVKSEDILQSILKDPSFQRAFWHSTVIPIQPSIVSQTTIEVEDGDDDQEKAVSSKSSTHTTIKEIEDAIHILMSTILLLMEPSTIAPTSTVFKTDAHTDTNHYLPEDIVTEISSRNNINTKIWIQESQTSLSLSSSSSSLSSSNDKITNYPRVMMELPPLKDISNQAPILVNEIIQQEKDIQNISSNKNEKEEEDTLLPTLQVSSYKAMEEFIFHLSTVPEGKIIPYTKLIQNSVTITTTSAVEENTNHKDNRNFSGDNNNGNLLHSVYFIIELLELSHRFTAAIVPDTTTNNNKIENEKEDKIMSSLEWIYSKQICELLTPQNAWYILQKSIKVQNKWLSFHTFRYIVKHKVYGFNAAALLFASNEQRKETKQRNQEPSVLMLNRMSSSKYHEKQRVLQTFQLFLEQIII